MNARPETHRYLHRLCDEGNAKLKAEGKTSRWVVENGHLTLEKRA